MQTVFKVLQKRKTCRGFYKSCPYILYFVIDSWWYFMNGIQPDNHALFIKVYQSFFLSLSSCLLVLFPITCFPWSISFIEIHPFVHAHFYLFEAFIVIHFTSIHGFFFVHFTSHFYSFNCLTCILQFDILIDLFSFRLVISSRYGR